jgi:hypothetical protein
MRAKFSGSMAAMTVSKPKPTIRQVYALTAALCERAGEAFPETRDDASELIERLRTENGHPTPRLEDVPFRPRERRRRPAKGEKEASRAATELVGEMQ